MKVIHHNIKLSITHIKISPTKLQPSKQQSEAGYQMIFARISSNHRLGTKLAGYIPHQELANIKNLGSLGLLQ
jgi:hypothetical protein